MVQDTATLASSVGLAGMALALVLFCVPMLTFKTILAEKNVLGFDGAPYVFGFLNCGLWVIYALPSVTPGRMEPEIINAVGLVLEFMYCVLYALYAPGKAFQREFGCSVAFLVILLVIVLSFEDPHQASPILGLIASILNIIMYASPLSVMKKVWYSQSVEFMPLHLSVATFFCSFCWFVYGSLLGDGAILFCNLCGVFLGLAQLGLYYRVSRYPDLSLVDLDKISSTSSVNLEQYSQLPGSDDALEEQPDLNLPKIHQQPENFGVTQDDFDAI